MANHLWVVDAQDLEHGPHQVGVVVVLAQEGVVVRRLALTVDQIPVQSWFHSLNTPIFACCAHRCLLGRSRTKRCHPSSSR